MTSKIKVNILADGADNSIITSDGAGSFTASSSLASSVQSVGGIQNTPSFQAFKATDQTISANSYVQIQFDTKDYDTNTCYNNTGSSTTLNGLTAPAYSFVPNVVGKYLIGAAVNSQTSTDFDAFIVAIFKNGTQVNRVINSNRHYDTAMTSFIVTANGTGDYFRNIIINGDMNIAQRSTSVASISSVGYYTIDRFKLTDASSGTWTQSQSTDVPTGQGFATSLKMDCTTADASPGSGDSLVLQQLIEGQNLQYLKKGTSSAESTTLSFWVKSNKTGTYICELRDIDNNRTISQSYTISSANTWEKKTITFAATMRTNPSLVEGTGTNAFYFERDNGSDYFNGWTALIRQTENTATLYVTGQSGTQGSAGTIYVDNDLGKIGFDAEL
jgi:hypothetical protein